ncbi:MAG TPA: M57 family metalloprotease [Thermoanaerobaculia bacterium]|jgi:hypothetical protein|nr:M57 family metalloprotease [Thermoanaerobaculia bacterium]
MRILIRLLIVSLLAAATSLQAITYIVPTDRDLVHEADAIVLAKAMCSYSQVSPDGRIVTVAELDVTRSLKGAFRKGDTLRLSEIGGSLTNITLAVPGSPRYENGVDYLVFVAVSQSGETATYGMGLGRFKKVTDLHGLTTFSRGMDTESIFGFDVNGAPHKELERDAVRFLSFIEKTVANQPASAEYYVPEREITRAPSTQRFVPRPTAGSSRGDYLSTGNARWQTPTAQWFSYHTQTGYSGGGIPALQNALGQWATAGVGINYTYGGTTLNHAGLHGASDSTNTVIFDDADGFVAQQRTQFHNANIAAIGGAWYPSSTYSLGGETFHPTSEGDVEVGTTISGVSETQFAMILTHELGHTLGFRHSDQTAANDPSTPCTAPLPCAGALSPPPPPAYAHAVMESSVSFAISGLQQYDLDAAQTVYGSGPVCTPPSIGTQPANTSISSGQQTTLTVAATGTSLTYQWYIGSSGTTTALAPNGTGTQLTVSPSTTTNYWVRVSGCSTSQDSRTAIVTVTCAPPSVPAPLASPSSIASGQSSILSVSPTGTAPFTYQWYVGSSGVTANPINGATSSSTTVSPATTTSYWVRVTGQCAPVADSPSTTVTVAACVPPSAPAPLASPSSISVGQSSNLSVSATGTGPFTYQWFVGSSGNQSNPIAGATGSFTTVSPAVTTSYWVKVTGQCAPASNSPATTVTVACTPIASGGVIAQPQTINVGQSSTISVTTSGNGPFTFQWFRGSLGDASNPIAGATGSNTIVSPVTSTTYWVRVTAPCGSQDGSVIVFVNAPCTASSITTHPASATIAPGGSATLTVVAAGTAPISYQWYTGTSGNTANPIAGATNASVTVSPTVSTSYWVRVSNSCNQTGNNSTTALVTVSVACPAPAITTQPASVSAGLGTAATLKVVATVTGTTIHYQWYKGAKGDLSTKVGTDSDTFTTGAVSVTTSYWVRLTAACSSSSTTDSNAAIVTAVAAARGRAVRH